MTKIGLGTAALGRPQYINIKKEKASPFSLEAFKQKGRDILDSAYDQGIRYFDTAPGYGMAEALLINWVRQKGDEVTALKNLGVKPSDYWQERKRLVWS